MRPVGHDEQPGLRSIAGAVPSHRDIKQATRQGTFASLDFLVATLNKRINWCLILTIYLI